MEFIIITGPQAVGKMTVGFEVGKKTGLKLFHNHMTIEPVIRLFDYKTKEAQYLIKTFREEIFKAMAQSDEKGMIFTYVWGFDIEHDHQYIQSLIDLFEDHDARVSIVELEADVEKRLMRNNTPLRLEEKPSKRNVAWSASELLECMEQHRLNSLEGEITHPHYLRINNTDLEADQVADKIIEYFELETL